MTLGQIAIEDLQQKNNALNAEVFSLNAENLFLKEQLEWFKRQIFGKKSERIVGANPDQLQFEGFESLDPQEAQ